jgi:hypothetical protein
MQLVGLGNITILPDYTQKSPWFHCRLANATRVPYLVYLGSCRLPSHGLVSKEILGIIGQNPNVSKSNQLHVVIFWFSFIDMRHILEISLK